MNAINRILGEGPSESPFSRGKRAAEEGRSAPAFPKGDANWEQKLYFRGYQSGTYRPSNTGKEVSQ